MSEMLTLAIGGEERKVSAGTTFLTLAREYQKDYKNPIILANLDQKLYELGIYAVSFTYPVVPKGRARIRTQVSAAHTKEDLEFAVRCFIEARRQMEEEDAKA